jgi:2-methylcitrate dehydratase PrpD
MTSGARPATTSAAARLAAFALELAHEEIPEDVRSAAKQHLLDALGCGLAAVALGEGVAGRIVAGETAGLEQATLIGSAARVPAPSAALANGMLIHALDFDDTHAEAVAHVSAVVVPAALAVAEEVGADGRELLVALVAANEIVTRIGAAASGEFHARGFHPTPIAGIFGAAAAAARLGGVGLEATVSAFGIAGSMASGLFAYLDDGTATKPIHAGWAAHAGILAARLAAAGAEGPPNVLEGRFGLFDAFLGRVPDLQRAVSDLGTRWETPRIAYKPYPACHFCHGALGAAASLDLDPDEVGEIVATVPRGAVDVVLEPAVAKVAPRTPYEAKFSLQYSLAALVAHGGVGTQTYTEEAILDPAVRALAGRVRYEVGEFPSSFGGAVDVRLDDGRVLRAGLPHPAGAPENPLGDAAVLAKFRDNAALSLAPADVGLLEESVRTLDEQADLAAVGQILSRASAGV